MLKIDYLSLVKISFHCWSRYCYYWTIHQKEMRKGRKKKKTTEKSFLESSAFFESNSCFTRHLLFRFQHDWEKYFIWSRSNEKSEYVFVCWIRSQIPNECINRYANRTNVFYVSCVNYLCLARFRDFISHTHSLSLSFSLSLCIAYIWGLMEYEFEVRERCAWAIHFPNPNTPKISFIPLL